MIKILIIDDDATIRLSLKKLLQRSGYEVDIASNGAEGLQKAENSQPHLIICDWMMPIMDGLQVCEKIKSNPFLATTYFILVTMRGEVDDRVKGLDTGADDYLSKPIDLNELQARIRAGLRLQKLTRELKLANEELSKVNQQLITRNDLLESLSLTDQLTGLLNRRAMDQALSHVLQQVGDTDNVYRYNYLTLFIMDVDHFKNVNDSYGHSVGDIVLQEISERLRNNAHPNSLLYRYGGEELVCMTPGLAPQFCIKYGEVLRLAIANYPIKISDDNILSVTISIGCTIATARNLVSAEDLLTQADQALYQAKREGRNCLRISPQTMLELDLLSK
jgi:diguanylate cyclase (GGDEF)-like protein